MTVLIGCGGWSHSDWIGRFYPSHIARKKEEWLRYYASFFNTVEINNTFDREPNEYLINGWINRGKMLKTFDYSITLPARIFKDADWALRFEEWCLSQLKDGGVLGYAVIQTPLGYQNNVANREFLRGILDVLDTSEYRYAVEFRDQSWFENGMLSESSQSLLQEYGAEAVFSDEFSSFEYFQNCGYLRLRGRLSPDNSYKYSEKELILLKNMLSEKEESCRVYFENSTAARCIYDALHLMDMLKIPCRMKEMRSAEAHPIIAK